MKIWNFLVPLHITEGLEQIMRIIFTYLFITKSRKPNTTETFAIQIAIQKILIIYP